MKWSFKLKQPSVASPSPASNLGFEKREDTKKAIRITKLSEHADFCLDKPLVIPCPAKLPEPASENVKYRKDQVKYYDPSAGTEEDWKSRQTLDSDLGPSDEMTRIFDARKADQEGVNDDKFGNNDQFGLIQQTPLTKTTPKTGPILSQARKVIVGESSQYDRVSVDDFGMAMLMGMGYNPEKESDTKPFVITRRAFTRAGLGADADFELPHERREREMRLQTMHKAEEDAKVDKRPVGKDVKSDSPKSDQVRHEASDVEDILQVQHESKWGDLRDQV